MLIVTEDRGLHTSDHFLQRKCLRFDLLEGP